MTVMIRKALEEDMEPILAVLRAYKCKVIHPVDNALIDDDYGQVISVVNELSALMLENAFVAQLDDVIVGFCHYKHYSSDTAKTTLMSVLPHYREFGVGRALQLARMKEAHDKGYRKMLTYCDVPKTMAWYQKNFNYAVLRTELNHHMLHFFSGPDGPIWLIHHGSKDEYLKVLECDLDAYFASH